MIGKNNFELFWVSRVSLVRENAGRDVHDRRKARCPASDAEPQAESGQKTHLLLSLPIARPKLPDKAVFVQFANERAVDEADRIYISESWILQLH